MINQLNDIAVVWFDWMLPVMIQTSALILIIAVIDLLIKKWAWPQLRYALWLLVIVKLLLPPTISSPGSITSNIQPLSEKVSISTTETDPVTVLNTMPQPVEINNPSPLTKEATTPLVTQPASPIIAMPIVEQKVQLPVPENQAIAASKVSLSGDTKPAASLIYKSWLFLIWLPGVMALGTFLLLKLRHLKNHAQRATNNQLPKWFDDILNETADRLKLRRLPEVILSEKTASPAVFGVFRVKLLLPANCANTMTPVTARHILLHELAHIKRGDLIVHAIYMVLQIAYWFNPLLWLIGKQLRHLRELSCDMTVARILKDETPEYRQTLLDTARKLLAESTEPGLGLLGLFEDSNRLLTRLQWLEKKTWKYHKLRIASITAITILMCICVLPMAAKDTDIAKEKAVLALETKEKPNSQFIATFDNGAIVELVGIREHNSSNKQWWKPDGSVLLDAPYDKINGTVHPHGKTKAYEFAVKFSSIPNGINTKIVCPDCGSSIGGSLNSGTYKDNKWLKDIGHLTTQLPEDMEQCKIKVAITSKKWNTVSSSNGKGGQSESYENYAIIFSPANNDSNNTSITVAHTIKDKDIRLIAIDSDGNTHRTIRLNSGGTDQITQLHATFDITMDKITTFKLQERDYLWKTFDNVVLKPSFKVQANQIIKDKAKLIKQNMHALSKAIEWYAEDHNYRIPDTLEQLKNYELNTDTFNWYLTNVKYRTKAQDNGPPSQRNFKGSAIDIIATSKPRNTDVYTVFRDGHIECHPYKKAAETGIVAKAPEQMPNTPVANNITNKAQNQPVPYNTVIERTLHYSGFFDNDLFDFKTNRVFKFPETVKFWDIPKWMLDNGIDIACTGSDNGPILTGNGEINGKGGNICKFINITMVYGSFDDMTLSYQDIVGIWKDNPSIDTTDHGGWDRLPQNFVFKSRTGDCGILEITDLNETDNTITFKYMLAEPVTPNKTNSQDINSKTPAATKIEPVIIINESNNRISGYKQFRNMIKFVESDHSTPTQSNNGYIRDL